jgi:hypothetical protein
MRLSQEAPGGRDIVRECDALNGKVDGLYSAMDGLRAVYGQMRGHASISKKKMAEASCRWVTGCVLLIDTSLSRLSNASNAALCF